MKLPRFKRKLIENGDVSYTVNNWAESQDERICIYAYAGEIDRAQSLAMEELQGYDCEVFNYTDGVVTVHCGPFTGYHGVDEEPSGELFVSSEGAYIHEPSDVEFDAECPDIDTLEDEMSLIASSPHPSDAAREVYNRTRL